MNRLHVRKLTSIGVVEEGDNPEAEILFWKSRPDKPGSESRTGPVSKAARESARARVSARPLTAAETAAVMKRLDRAQQAIGDIADDHKKIRTEMEMADGTTTETTSAATVRADVDRLAAAMVEAGEATNMAQARPIVWKSRPDLVAKSRQESSPRPEEGSGKTISDRVLEVIGEATRRASWQPLMQGWGDGKTRDQILAKVRVEVWRSPDGRELRDLQRAFGARPYTPATSSEIRKSQGGNRFVRALNLLDSGIWEQ